MCLKNVSDPFPTLLNQDTFQRSIRTLLATSFCNEFRIITVLVKKIELALNVKWKAWPWTLNCRFSASLCFGFLICQTNMTLAAPSMVNSMWWISCSWAQHMAYPPLTAYYKGIDVHTALIIKRHKRPWHPKQVAEIMAVVWLPII